MNRDLISRKAIVRELLIEREKHPVYTEERYSLGVKTVDRFNAAMRGCIRKALRIAETAPAVDAVEVVRCKDCVLWKRIDENTGKCPFLIGEHQYAGADHYCSCGERKEEDTDEQN